MAHLVGLVEDCERSLVLWLRRVLKVLDVGTNNLAIGDEEALRSLPSAPSFAQKSKTRSRTCPSIMYEIIIT